MKVITNARGRELTVVDVTSAVGEGWEKVVRSLLDDLFSLGWDGKLHQVKEKYGGLRFYIGESSDEMAARISAAEKESLKTCYHCGNPGVLRGGSWWLTTCDEHAI